MDIVHEILDDSDKGARRLIDEYGGRLTAAAISLCSNEAEAKDLVSETVDIAVRQIGSYRNEAVLFEWLFGIMKNLYRHSRRRMSATNEIAVPNLPEVSAVKPDEGVQQVLQAVDAGILRDAVNALPPDMREAVVLRYFMDMPLVQIAKFLSLPVGTVKSRLHYARIALAARLGAKLKKPVVALIALGLFLAASAAAVVVAVRGRTGATAPETIGTTETTWTAETTKTAGTAETAGSTRTPETAGTEATFSSVSVGSAVPDVPAGSDYHLRSVNNQGDTEMNIKAKAMTVLAAATLATAPAAQAKTVAWYHLDERGSHPNYADRLYYSLGDIVENAADPGNLQGMPRGLKDSPKEPSNNQVPTCTNDFPAGVTWYDPVTGARGENRGCLWMRSQYDNGTGESSVILVNDDRKLHCANLTVEFMARYNSRAGKSLSGRAHLMGLRNSASANVKAWGIHVIQAGDICVELQTPTSDGTAVDTSVSLANSDFSASSTLLDGKWHHVAITYDGTTLKLYFDYVLKKSQAWGRAIAYNEACQGMLTICGADKAGYGHWQGFIDEVRISDAALEPWQFIHPGALCPKAPSVADTDTSLYLPFDSVETSTDPFFGTVNAPIVFNAAATSNAPAVRVTLPTSYMPPTMTVSTVSNIIHDGIFATNSVSDDGAWDFGANSAAAGRSLLMYVDDYTATAGGNRATSGDFTVEFFLNMHQRPSSTRYLLRELSASGTAWYMLFSTNSANRLSCDLVPGGGGTTVTIKAEGFTYNEWHHVAMVISRKLSTASLYVDGTLKSQVCDFNLVAAADSANSLIIGGGGWSVNGSDQFQDLSIDELRITKRALAPQEFLAAGVNGTTALEPTRAWVGFEDDLTVEPRPDEIPAGSASALTVYSGVIPGIKIIDGNGTVLRRSNTASMQFSGANEKTMFGRNILLEKDMESQTIEFFMKAPKDSAREWAYMLRAYSAPLETCQSSASDSATIMNWTIGYGGATVANPTFRSGEVYVGAVTADFPTSSVTRNFNDVEGEDAKLDDGLWHHVAVTFEPNDTTNTLVTFYKDYKRCGTPKNINGRMKQIVGVSESCLGMGCNFTGWIDEVRISKGILTVDEMLHAQKRGTAIILR